MSAASPSTWRTPTRSGRRPTPCSRASPRQRPRPRIEGFAVQPMIRRPNAHELIVGASDDPQFGPVILFGHGGTAVEVVADRALALPPLNMRLAHDLMAQTRVPRLLARLSRPPAGRPRCDRRDADQGRAAGHRLGRDRRTRHQPAARRPARRDRARRADPGGAPRQRRRSAGSPSAPIRRSSRTRSSSPAAARLLLRPIRPEDEPVLIAAFHKLSPENRPPALLRAGQGTHARDGGQLHADRLRPGDGAGAGRP